MTMARIDDLRLVLVAMFCLGMSAGPLRAEAFKAIAKQGTVTVILPGKGREPLALGMQIPVGSVIITGSDGTAILQKGSSFMLIKIHPNTNARLTEKGFTWGGIRDLLLRVRKMVFRGGRRVVDFIRFANTARKELVFTSRRWLFF